MGRGGRGGRDRRILDRKSLGCLSNGGSAAMAAAAAAAAQCFALGIFDCRITNETPTFGIIVRRPDTSSWAATAAAADAKEQLNSFVNLLLSLSLSSAKGGREGRDDVRARVRAGMLNMTHPGGAALPQLTRSFVCWGPQPFFEPLAGVGEQSSI